MKAGRLAVVAIVLWLASALAFAWFFVHGNTAAGSDGRTAVVLAPAERDLILLEMRGLLAGTHEILEGIVANDRKRIASASRAIGMGAAADVNPVLMGKLPLPFKQLGMSVHADMDALAQAAESGKPLPELQRMLSDSMAKCVGCHSAWQFSR
jgi:hypothetical protein